jgi:pyrimidine deaminase RibD-like protein
MTEPAPSWEEPSLEAPGRGKPGCGAGVNEADRGWLGDAIALSRRCPPSMTAFAVGAVLVARDGSVLATGYSRESSPHDHAEEAALAKVDPADLQLA